MALIGKPTVVECVIPIKDVAGYQIMNLANQIINYWADVYIKGINYNIDAEINVEYDVAVDKILGIWYK